APRPQIFHSTTGQAEFSGTERSGRGPRSRGPTSRDRSERAGGAAPRRRGRERSVSRSFSSRRIANSIGRQRAFELGARTGPDAAASQPGFVASSEGKARRAAGGSGAQISRDTTHRAQLSQRVGWSAAAQGRSRFGFARSIRRSPLVRRPTFDAVER